MFKPGRCISACKHYTGLEILNFNNRGFEHMLVLLLITTWMIQVVYIVEIICPVEHSEHDDTAKVLDLLEDKEYYTVAK